MNSHWPVAVYTVGALVCSVLAFNYMFNAHWQHAYFFTAWSFIFIRTAQEFLS